MFDVFTTRSKILAGATVIGIVATTISAVKDMKDTKKLLECKEELDELLDPLADVDVNAD